MAWYSNICIVTFIWCFGVIFNWKFFFKDLIKKILKKKFNKYLLLFQKNEFFYFFIYRFVGGLGIPFFLQNLLPILFGMKKRNYFLASCLGFIPTFFIMNTIGSGLNIYIKQASNFSMINLILSKRNLYTNIYVYCFMAISLFFKKKFLMIEINKNNLFNDLSPYLKQHKDNPVNWQIWSKETLDYAKKIKNQFY